MLRNCNVRDALFSYEQEVALGEGLVVREYVRARVASAFLERENRYNETGKVS